MAPSGDGTSRSAADECVAQRFPRPTVHSIGNDDSTHFKLSTIATLASDFASWDTRGVTMWKSGIAALALLGATALTGCGTQTAHGGTRMTAHAAAATSTAPSPANPALDPAAEATLEGKVAHLAANSMPVTIDFIAAGRDQDRGQSTIAGKRLADVMASHGLDPLPADADVWLARVSAPTLGKVANPNSRDTKITDPLFKKSEVVWVLYYKHVSQGPTTTRSISDPLPSPPSASPSIWYSDMIYFVKPSGFFGAVTVG